MDSAPINFESVDEIFGCSQAATRYPLEDGEMDYLLLDKNISVTESSSLIESAIEVVSQNSFSDYLL